MAREEENTKAAIDNSDSNPIEAYNRGIKRLEELIRTLDNYVLKQPHKEFLALDLWEFLEEYPWVRGDIEIYINRCLWYLREKLQGDVMYCEYRKRIIELEQQPKEKGNDTELH